MTDPVPINRWVLTCQNRYVIGNTGSYRSLGLGADSGLTFTVFDMGDGTLVLMIQGGGGAPDIYPTATNSFLTDYQVITDTLGWITQITDAAKFKAIPTGDGYFALYYPAFAQYLRVNPQDAGELQVMGQLDQAARFTAAGVDHDSIFDLLRVGKSARGMVFDRISLANCDLTGTNLSQCDLRNVTSLSGCKLNSALLEGTRFAGLRLGGLQISGADCTRADFTGCDFTSFEPGTPPPVLAQANLSGAVVPAGVSWSGANMPGVVLAGANLTGCDLSGPATNLTGANFSGAGKPAMLAHCNMGQANLSRASLAGVDLSGVQLPGAKLADADLISANLTGTQLSGATLTGANLAGANLAGTQLSGTTLDGADLTGANVAATDFTGTDLTQVHFSFPLSRSTDPDHPTIFAGCTLPYSVIKLDWSCLDLTGVTITGLPTDLTGLNAYGLRWPAGNFSGFILDRANFAGATLDQAVFTKTKLRGKPSFAGARLIGAVFAQAVLEEAAFTGATLGGVAHMAAANFSSAYLSGCDFSQANLYGVIFALATLDSGNALTGATNLEQTDFSGAYLPNTDFTGANMQGARLDFAFMVECVLSNADLRPAGQGAVPASLAGAWLQAASLDGTKLMAASLGEAFITDQRGQITYQYYGEDGKLTAEAPMRYPAGSYPDPASFDADTLCPNNQTYGANQRNRLSMDQMMTSSAGPAEKWTPPTTEDLLQAPGQRGSGAGQPSKRAESARQQRRDGRPGSPGRRGV